MVIKNLNLDFIIIIVIILATINVGKRICKNTLLLNLFFNTPNLTLYFPLKSSILSVVIRFTGLIVLLSLHFNILFCICESYTSFFLIFNLLSFFLPFFYASILLVH